MVRLMPMVSWVPKPPVLVPTTPGAPSTPASPSEFLSYLADHPKTPTRELVQPFLSYEIWLRKAFAKKEAGVADLAGLVPIYDGKEKLFKNRAIDRQSADEQKYVMRLPDDALGKDGDLAIAATLSQYRSNFDGFTHGILEGLDWSNIVVAGSSALLPLLPFRTDVKIKYRKDVENAMEAYYQSTARSSDIDIFFYGLDSEAVAAQRILDLEASIRKNQRLRPGEGLCLRSENAITFISPRWPFRHVQIILRLYKSISEILTGFDVDCACVAFDGKQVYSNPRAITAISTHTNTIDLSRRSPSYENRLWKYRNQNFDVFWDSLDRSRVTREFDFGDIRNLQGLARLLYSEWWLKEARYRVYVLKRSLKKFDDSGEPDLTPQSGYASHDIPYGERFTATRVRQYVEQHSREPYMFGTVKEVVEDGAKSSKNDKLVGRVRFLQNDPGRQMIGSFHPLSGDDWAKMAYEE